MAQTIGSVLIDVKADTQKLVTGFEKAEKTVKRTTENMKKAVTTLAAAYISFQGINAFASTIKGTIDAADALGELSEKLAIGVKDLSRLDYASKFAGVSLGQLNAAMGAMIRRTGNFKSDGGGAASKAMDELGISVEFARQHFTDTNTTFMILLDRLNGVEDATLRTKLAQDLFSKSASDIVRLANMGADEIKRLGDEGERTGVVISDELAKSAGELNDSIDKLSLNFQGLTNQIAGDMIPTLNDAAIYISENKDELFETAETVALVTASIVATNYAMKGYAATLAIVKASQIMFTTTSLALNGALVATAAASKAATIAMRAIPYVAIASGIYMIADALLNAKDEYKAIQDAIDKNSQGWTGLGYMEDLRFETKTQEIAEAYENLQAKQKAMDATRGTQVEAHYKKLYDEAKKSYDKQEKEYIAYTNKILKTDADVTKKREKSIIDLSDKQKKEAEKIWKDHIKMQEDALKADQKAYEYKIQQQEKVNNLILQELDFEMKLIAFREKKENDSYTNQRGLEQFRIDYLGVIGETEEAEKLKYQRIASELAKNPLIKLEDIEKYIDGLKAAAKDEDGNLFKGWTDIVSNSFVKGIKEALNGEDFKSIMEGVIGSMGSAFLETSLNNIASSIASGKSLAPGTIDGLLLGAGLSALENEISKQTAIEAKLNESIKKLTEATEQLYIASLGEGTQYRRNFTEVANDLLDSFEKADKAADIAGATLGNIGTLIDTVGGSGLEFVGNIFGFGSNASKEYETKRNDAITALKEHALVLYDNMDAVGELKKSFLSLSDTLYATDLAAQKMGAESVQSVESFFGMSVDKVLQELSIKYNIGDVRGLKADLSKDIETAEFQSAMDKVALIVDDFGANAIDYIDEISSAVGYLAKNNENLDKWNELTDPKYSKIQSLLPTVEGVGTPNVQAIENLISSIKKYGNYTEFQSLKDVEATSGISDDGRIFSGGSYTDQSFENIEGLIKNLNDLGIDASEFSIKDYQDEYRDAVESGQRFTEDTMALHTEINKATDGLRRYLKYDFKDQDIGSLVFASMDDSLKTFREVSIPTTYKELDALATQFMQDGVNGYKDLSDAELEYLRVAKEGIDQSNAYIQQIERRNESDKQRIQRLGTEAGLVIDLTQISDDYIDVLLDKAKADGVVTDAEYEAIGASIEYAKSLDVIVDETQRLQQAVTDYESAIGSINSSVQKEISSLNSLLSSVGSAINTIGGSLANYRGDTVSRADVAGEIASFDTLSGEMKYKKATDINALVGSYFGDETARIEADFAKREEALKTEQNRAIENYRNRHDALSVEAEAIGKVNNEIKSLQDYSQKLLIDNTQTSAEMSMQMYQNLFDSSFNKLSDAIASNNVDYIGGYAGDTREYADAYIQSAKEGSSTREEYELAVAQVANALSSFDLKEETTLEDLNAGLDRINNTYNTRISSLETMQQEEIQDLKTQSILWLEDIEAELEQEKFVLEQLDATMRESFVDLYEPMSNIEIALRQINEDTLSLEQVQLNIQATQKHRAKLEVLLEKVAAELAKVSTNTATTANNTESPSNLFTGGA